MLLSNQEVIDFPFLCETEKNEYIHSSSLSMKMLAFFVSLKAMQKIKRQKEFACKTNSVFFVFYMALAISPRTKVRGLALLLGNCIYPYTANAVSASKFTYELISRLIAYDIFYMALAISPRTKV